MAPKAKSAKTAHDPPLLPQHEALLALYASTLTAASFLGPKGVLCLLSRLAPTVRALARLELTAEHLRQMCALDASLALRHAVGANGEADLELILRESLRTVATPGAVRSRCKRFRGLLAARADAELPLAPLPPAPAGMGRLAPSSPVSRRAAGGSTAAGGTHAASGTAEMLAPSPETSGLPSPPPRPLRRAGLASLSPPDRGRIAHVLAARAGSVGVPECSGGAAEAWGGDRAGCGHAANADAASSAASVGSGVQPGARSGVDGDSTGAGGRARAAEHESSMPAEPSGATVPNMGAAVPNIGAADDTPVGADRERPGDAAEGERAPKQPRASACERFLRELRRSPFLRDQIVHIHEQPARAAAYAVPSVELAAAVHAVLKATGRTRLYTHQARAVEALMGGGHAMLCTPTASGERRACSAPPPSPPSQIWARPLPPVSAALTTLPY